MNVVRHLKFMYDISKALKWCCKNEYYISSKYSLRFNIDTVYREIFAPFAVVVNGRI